MSGLIKPAFTATYTFECHEFCGTISSGKEELIRGFELFVNGRLVIAEGETQGSIALRSGTYISLKAIYRVSNNVENNATDSFMLHWFSSGSSTAS